jgi:hypothetical protein
LLLYLLRLECLKFGSAAETTPLLTLPLAKGICFYTFGRRGVESHRGADVSTLLACYLNFAQPKSFERAYCKHALQT